MNTMTDGTPVTTPTTNGPVRGMWHRGAIRYAGIPYAAPPVGDLRFRPPHPVESWTDVRSADFFGPISPQNPSMMDALFGSDAEQWDEDCLYLNVWTPADTTAAPAAAPLPVMVWIHGGGFEMGSGSSPMYDGTRFATSGVVLVTLNYRLGSLGFLELGDLDPEFEGSGNLGLLDQIAALEWVRDNIATFGGDPDNVTVFGQSAGSMSISLLMSTSRASGLFHRAITQSGSTSAARTPELARIDAAEFLQLGGWSTAAEVRAAPVAELLAAHAAQSAARFGDPEAFIRRTGNPVAFLSFRPVADGVLVPTDPLAAIAGGSAAGVTLLTGSTSEEWRLFALMSPPPATEAALLDRLGLLVADPEAALAVYRSVELDATLAEVECSLLTDLIFRIPTVRMADAQLAHAPVFQYLWDWKSEAFGGMIGAAHAIDIPFVFDLIEDHRLHVFIGADAPADLARATNTSWIEFAKTGRPAAPTLPAWPHLGEPHDGGRPVMVLDNTPHLEPDPDGVTRKFWDTAGASSPF